MSVAEASTGRAVHRRRSVVVVALAAAVAALAVPAADATPVTVVAVTDSVVGTVNRDLVGFGWHQGGAPLAAVAPLDPHLVRVDASLERVSTAQDAPLALAPLLARVAEVRAAGGEPLVILSYLPAWLGEPVAAGRNPTRVRPADLDEWQRVVHEVVLALATAPAPAVRFEAWNEPDSPLFWQDTPTAWVETVERSARAVAAVEADTGIDLAFGGPAMAVPDPVYLLPFLARFRDPALPLDFVSWHYYGNTPFFGPDGTEFDETEPVQPVLGRRNPLASPAAYGPQVAFVREMTVAALAGSGRAMPELVIDEWNISAAGFDRRHDSAAGAAFAAGVLVELQDAGLDAAAFFMATDTRGVPGEHGAVTVDGARKPVWWAFALWQRLAPSQVAVHGGADRLWVLASTRRRCVTVLLASFEGTARSVRLELPRPVRAATVRRIDDAHPDASAAARLPVDGSSVTIELGATGVALVELQTIR